MKCRYKPPEKSAFKKLWDVSPSNRRCKTCVHYSGCSDKKTIGNENSCGRYRRK